MQCSDLGIPLPLSSFTSVLIFVTRPHPPSFLFRAAPYNITKNTAPHTSLGYLVLETNEGILVDPLDFPDDLLFSIVGGDSSELFVVDEITGELSTANVTLDREEASTHVIEVLANFTRFDNYLPVHFVRASFIIDVLDDNDNPPTMLSDYAVVIDDSVETGQVLFNVTATDQDMGLNALVFFDIDSSWLFGVQITEIDLPFTFGEIFLNDTRSLIAGTYS